MKLLLNMLAATSLMVATSTNIISCGNPTNQDSTPPKDDLNQKFLEKILQANPRLLFRGELIIGGEGESWTTTINFDNNGTLPWENILNFVVDCYQDPNLNIFQEIINKKKFTIQDNLSGKKWNLDAKNVQIADPDLIKFANNLKVETNWEGKLKSFYFEGHKNEAFLIPLSKEKIFATKICDVFDGWSNIKIYYPETKVFQQFRKVINLDFANQKIMSHSNFQLKSQNQEETKEIKNMTGQGFLNYLNYIGETHEILNTFNEGFKQHGEGDYYGEKINAHYNFTDLKLKEGCEQISIFIDKVNYSWNEESLGLVIDYPY